MTIYNIADEKTYTEEDWGEIVEAINKGEQIDISQAKLMHQLMWSWLSQLDYRTLVIYSHSTIGAIKDHFLRSIGLPRCNLYNGCFLCHYMYQEDLSCSNCPAVWRDSSSICERTIIHCYNGCERSGKPTKYEKFKGLLYSVGLENRPPTDNETARLRKYARNIAKVKWRDGYETEHYTD